MPQEEQKPAYGMLAFSRVTGGDPNLFGSSIKHNEKLRLTLKTGAIHRDIHNDWYFGRNTLFEVEMSYTQFAELISSMNVGDGIPVTIRYIQGEGQIPGIEIVNRKTQFTNEFATQSKAASQKAKDLIATVKDLFETKKQLTKADKSQIMSILTNLSYEIDDNRSFAMECFHEATEGIISEAKGEIEAFVENRMHHLALAALSANPDLLTPTQSVVISLPEESEKPSDKDTTESSE